MENPDSGKAPQTLLKFRAPDVKINSFLFRATGTVERHGLRGLLWKGP